ncbi:MAG: cyclic-di-AMP receptor [Chloroflexota bacterium]
MDESPLDRLAILTVSGSQVNLLMKHLQQAGFNFTVMHTTEGVITEAEICLLVGFRNERMPVLLDLVREKCRPYRRFVSTQGFLPGDLATSPVVEAELGGARFWMMNVERFEQI